MGRNAELEGYGKALGETQEPLRGFLSRKSHGLTLSSTEPLAAVLESRLQEAMMEAGTPV